MEPGTSQLEYQLTAEQETRSQRYRASLEHIQNSELEDLYPPEMKQREWTEVTDEAELHEARGKLGNLKSDVPPKLYGLYRDADGEHLYFVRRFNAFPKVTNVQLDMLATAREIAPWAKQKGLVFESPLSAEKAWTGTCKYWTFRGNLISGDAAMLEKVVNGLGDPKNSLGQKTTLICEDISAFVHENTHINNVNISGPGGPIPETAPMASEYLAFPGKNGKMKIVTTKARKRLLGEQEKVDSYDDATLIGMLVMARDEGLLPEEEDLGKMDQGLEAWQKMVESLPRDELSSYRRKVEAEWLLSQDDEKLHAKLRELRQHYPELIHRLIGDFELKGEKV